MTSTRLPPQASGRRTRALRVLKTVPILPSLVTLGNTFFGFLAIAKAGDAALVLAAANGAVTPAVTSEFFHKIEVAALLIFVAMVFDALDGAVARMTRQTSAFGAQLDSMADMVTFGVAPAFVAKMLIDYHTMGAEPAITLGPRIIYVVAVVYVLSATMRLARFNVEIPSDSAEDHQEFSGLPSPAAAATVAASLYFFCALQAPVANQSAFIAWMDGLDVDIWLVRAIPVILVVSGLLMISRFPYPHVVVRMLRGGHSFPFLATIVVMALVVAIEHEFGVLLGILIYVVSGLLLGVYRLLTTRRLEAVAEVEEIDDRFDPPGPSLN